MKLFPPLLSSRRPVRSFGLIVCLVCVGCERSPAAGLSLITDNERSDLLGHLPADNLNEVRRKVDRVLASVYAEELPGRFPNWIAFHALLMHGDSAYEQLVQKRADSNLSRIWSVVLTSDSRLDGPFVLREGSLYPRRSGPYFSREHHLGQFLNYFSMSGASETTPITVDGVPYAIEDVLNRSLRETDVTEELAFVVLACSHYLEPDRRWTNKFGESMSLGKLLGKLLDTPEATCLGTHRLAALARILSRPQFQADREIGNLWPRLERQVASALSELKESQQIDGEFKPREDPPGRASTVHRNIYYGGHSLEWITFLDGNYMRDEWIVRAVDSLAESVESTFEETYRRLDVVGDPDSFYDFDGLAHAVSALRRWRDQFR